MAILGSDSAKSLMLNAVLLIISFSLFYSVQWISKFDKLLLKWYDRNDDLFSNETIYTLTQPSPRSYGQSSALSLHFNPHIHGSLMTRQDEISFSMTGNILNKRHSASYANFFEIVRKKRGEESAQACIKVQLALRSMNMTVYNSGRDIFLALPFLEEPPINVSMKIIDHYLIEGYSKAYIAMLSSTMGSCVRNSGGHIVFRDYEHPVEYSRFGHIATRVYEEALFYFLNEDIAKDQQQAPSSNNITLEGNVMNDLSSKASLISPKKEVNDAHHRSKKAKVDSAGVPIAMNKKIADDNVKTVGLTPLKKNNIMYIKSPTTNQVFDHSTSEIVIQMMVNFRMYSWLVHSKIPYSFIFVYNGEKVDVTKLINQALGAAYQKYPTEVMKTISRFESLLNADEQSYPLLFDRNSISSVLNYLAQYSKEDYSKPIALTNFLKYTPVSIFVKSLPNGTHALGLEMWCQLSEGSTKEMIASDVISISKI